MSTFSPIVKFCTVALQPKSFMSEKFDGTKKKQEGQLRIFNPMRNSTTRFKEKVLTVVASIPKGETLSYKEVACRARILGASRAVGTIMAGNFDPKIPCHRVIKSDGTAGGYNGGVLKKIRILKKEGVIVKPS